MTPPGPRRPDFRGPMPISRPPDPLTPVAAPWPDAPRFVPEWPLPAYRHLPGHTPHPITHPEGHSHGADWEPPWLPPAQWAVNKPYLFGADLYHLGYLWESHEAWEGLWRQCSRESAEGCFLQALILNSAALLKARLGQWRGAANNSRKAWRLFARFREMEAPGADGRYMGLDPAAFQEALAACYQPLWSAAGHGETIGPPPRLPLRRTGVDEPGA